MRRRKKINEDEISSQDLDEEENDSELTEKEQKKLKQKESVQKRKNAIKKDKVARWGGLILLGLVMFAGFLLWVSGEIKQESIESLPKSSVRNSVIVK